MTMISEAFNYNAMASNNVLVVPFNIPVHCIGAFDEREKKKKKKTSTCTHTQTKRKSFFFLFSHSFRVNAFWSRFWDFKTFKYRINDADLQHWHSGQCSMDDLTQIIAFHLPHTNILIACRAQIHLAAVNSHLMGLAYVTTFFSVNFRIYFKLPNRWRKIDNFTHRDFCSPPKKMCIKS